MTTTMRSTNPRRRPPCPARPRLRDRQHGPQGPARRQGRQPRRDDRLGFPCRPASRSPLTPAASTFAPGPSRPHCSKRSRAPRSARTRTGRRLGDSDDPLLVSVRSGAKFSMPGMMETVLNIGLDDTSVEGLARQTGNQRFAWDSYRRLVRCTARPCSTSTATGSRTPSRRPRPPRRSADIDHRRSTALVAEYQEDPRSIRPSVSARPIRAAREPCSRCSARGTQAARSCTGDKRRPDDPAPP